MAEYTVSDPVFISTTIPYVNGRPHIGHSLEFVQTDAYARYQRLLGREVFFLTGSDENSLKNVQAAEAAGVPVQAFVDEYCEYIRGLKGTLNIQFDEFIRTTEARHFAGAKKLWSMCKPEDIYKKRYKGLYCVGCEAFYTEDELVEGRCSEHPNRPLEEVEEENYFFRLSSYQEKLTQLIESDELRIVPEFRKNEVLGFLRQGLQDFSISRSAARAHGWGVPVPGDESQIMYVWFDALSNYITALNFAGDEKLYGTFWKQSGASKRRVIHCLGKGVIRFHAVYWIGMLLSAGLPLPTEELVHGYLTVNGQRIGKSLGNVIEPADLVSRYGVDAVRYFLLGALSPFYDGDFTESRLSEFYGAHLANGFGNLFSRTVGMVEKYCGGKVPALAEDVFGIASFWSAYRKAFENYEFDVVVRETQALVTRCDGLISEAKPWAKFKAGESVDALMYQLLEAIRHIALALLPIIPEKAAAVLSALGQEISGAPLRDATNWGALESGRSLEKPAPLFPRLEVSAV